MQYKKLRKTIIEIQKNFFKFFKSCAWNVQDDFFPTTKNHVLFFLNVYIFKGKSQISMALKIFLAGFLWFIANFLISYALFF